MKTISKILISISFIFLSLNVSAQGMKFDLGNTTELLETDKAWKYHSGDDTAWANPSFNDSQWDTIMPDEYSEETENYSGIAWFRCTVNVNDSLKNRSLAFAVEHMGASEIYIDGKLIKQFGKVSSKKEEEVPYNPHGEPVNFTFDKAGEHFFAVRYSNHKAEHNLKTYNEDFAGFTLDIHASERATKRYANSIFFVAFLYTLGIGFFMTLSLLHFAIFLFYKSERSNLYYSLFTVSLALTFLSLLISQNIHSPCYILSLELVADIMNVLNTLFVVTLIYSFLYTGFPKRFWIGVSFVCLYMILVFTKISWAETLSYVISFASIIEVSRLLIVRFFRKYDPNKKIKRRLKYFFLILAVILIVTGFINVIIPVVILAILCSLIALPIICSVFIIPVYMSLHHARSFSSTNKNLEEQLRKVTELSAITLEQEREKQKIIEAQKESLEIQVAERTIELSQKNLEITDSINYAKRIQSAILPPVENIKAVLPESFILYQPKDIVSGDFYWFHLSPGSSSQGDNAKILIAAADCTGHGVPGALMSVISSEKLTEAAQTTLDVSEILSKTNRGIKKALRQSDREESTRDGMDIAICNIDKNLRQVTFAGANRPLWIIKKGAHEIFEAKATKRAIGGLTDDEQQFEKHTIQLNEGDALYLFTDGYADQFSSQDKKLMTRKFKEIILSIQDKSMEEQREYLGSFIENWKGNMEQTDDILVIGVRV